jgi:Protein of unknown function (DUF2782)
MHVFDDDFFGVNIFRHYEVNLMRIPLHSSRFVAPFVGSLFAALLIIPQAVLAEEPESSGEVTIQGDGGDVVEELRVNGQLYAIRVTPKRGVPYYLVDSDGDGNLETRNNDTDPSLLIPAWVIKQW